MPNTFRRFLWSLDLVLGFSLLKILPDVEKPNDKLPSIFD